MKDESTVPVGSLKCLYMIVFQKNQKIAPLKRGIR